MADHGRSASLSHVPADFRSERHQVCVDSAIFSRLTSYVGLIQKSVWVSAMESKPDLPGKSVRFVGRVTILTAAEHV